MKGPAVMVGGHTHLQMLRRHHGTLLVSPGSVGLPFEAYVNTGRCRPDRAVTKASASDPNRGRARDVHRAL